MDPDFSCCDSPGRKGLCLSFKMREQLLRNGFSIGFMLDCETPRKPPRASSMISGIPTCARDGGGHFILECYSRWNLGP
jgi:hypothetical protein